MKRIIQQKNWNYEYRLQLKIDYLKIIKELYWTMDYLRIEKVNKRYKYITFMLKKNNISPTFVIVQFIPAKKLIELIKDEELTYSKLNDNSLLI